jgi:hypothetical protein
VLLKDVAEKETKKDASHNFSHCKTAKKCLHIIFLLPKVNSWPRRREMQGNVQKKLWLLVRRGSDRFFKRDVPVVRIVFSEICVASQLCFAVLAGFHGKYF